MNKSLKLFIVLIVVLILSGCNMSKPVDSEVLKEQGKSIAPANLSTEQGISEYLVGEWVCNMEYMSNIVVIMNIDEDLDLQLSFYDSITNESKGDYKGKIIFDRIYANSNEPPDLISIELTDSDYSKGDFFFLHRTTYNGKRVMSLFFAGNGNSVFNILAGDDDYGYMIEEVMLEKVTGEILQGNPRKNDQFYAVFWGHGVHKESIWIDDVQWTPTVEYDFEALYPRPMTLYENDRPESVLYSVDPDKKFDILGDDIFKGGIYYVETDKNGNIVELIDADYKRYLESGANGDIDPEIKDLIFDISNEIVEIQEYLDEGMSILFTGETTLIEDEECYDIALGTNHEDTFVREIHYAVNISTRQVYKYDVLNDLWEAMGVG